MFAGCLRNRQNVSIPSTGRVLLQEDIQDAVAEDVKCFNTLYGSSVTASAALLEKPSLKALAFQYPLRVECYCKCSLYVIKNADFLFQYPLRVECYCKMAAAHKAELMFLKFQYPLRVECYCKTKCASRSCPTVKFQYPLRVECYCKSPKQRSRWVHL